MSQDDSEFPLQDEPFTITLTGSWPVLKCGICQKEFEDGEQIGKATIEPDGMRMLVCVPCGVAMLSDSSDLTV